ncbi:hypothetical protein PAPYR_6696 [Paratrimastix pyriformis]|uniref:RING-type domain-containing protein n=1 Tax=Paratrimastix pyriformis TaxID=342808 RepID=A0ABQ8UER2_9EUKA|nr:hypothetical protein PAPYR_6696 [Paratrimastix pyriformis]
MRCHKCPPLKETRVYTFIDDSNFRIGPGNRFPGEPKFDRILLRYDLLLREIIVRDRTFGKVCLIGSDPPPYPNYYKDVERLIGCPASVFPRSATGEVQNDTALGFKAFQRLAEPLPPGVSGVIALVTGDRDFLPVVERVHELAGKGFPWTVEVYSWADSAANEMRPNRRPAKLIGGRLLDEMDLHTLLADNPSDDTLLVPKDHCDVCKKKHVPTIKCGCYHSLCSDCLVCASMQCPICSPPQEPTKEYVFVFLDDSNFWLSACGAAALDDEFPDVQQEPRLPTDPRIRISFNGLVNFVMKDLRAKPTPLIMDRIPYEYLAFSSKKADPNVQTRSVDWTSNPSQPKWFRKVFPRTGNRNEEKEVENSILGEIMKQLSTPLPRGVRGVIALFAGKGANAPFLQAFREVPRPNWRVKVFGVAGSVSHQLYRPSIPVGLDGATAALSSVTMALSKTVFGTAASCLGAATADLTAAACAVSSATKGFQETADIVSLSCREWFDCGVLYRQTDSSTFVQKVSNAFAGDKTLPAQQEPEHAEPKDADQPLALVFRAEDRSRIREWDPFARRLDQIFKTPTCFCWPKHRDPSKKDYSPPTVVFLHFPQLPRKKMVLCNVPPDLAGLAIREGDECFSLDQCVLRKNNIPFVAKGLVPVKLLLDHPTEFLTTPRPSLLVRALDPTIFPDLHPEPVKGHPGLQVLHFRTLEEANNVMEQLPRASDPCLTVTLHNLWVFDDADEGSTSVLGPNNQVRDAICAKVQRETNKEKKQNGNWINDEERKRLRTVAQRLTTEVITLKTTAENLLGQTVQLPDSSSLPLLLEPLRDSAKSLRTRDQNEEAMEHADSMEDIAMVIEEREARRQDEKRALDACAMRRQRRLRVLANRYRDQAARRLGVEAAELSDVADQIDLERPLLRPRVPKYVGRVGTLIINELHVDDVVKQIQELWPLQPVMTNSDVPASSVPATPLAPRPLPPRPLPPRPLPPRPLPPRPLPEAVLTWSVFAKHHDFGAEWKDIPWKRHEELPCPDPLRSPDVAKATSVPVNAPTPPPLTPPPSAPPPPTPPPPTPIGLPAAQSVAEPVLARQVRQSPAHSDAPVIRPGPAMPIRACWDGLNCPLYRHVRVFHPRGCNCPDRDRDWAHTLRFSHPEIPKQERPRPRPW